VIRVSEIKFSGRPNGAFLAYVSAILDECLLLRGMRLVRHERLILSMPARQDSAGEWREIYHPIRREAREILEAAVFAAYERHGVYADGQ